MTLILTLILILVKLDFAAASDTGLTYRPVAFSR
jgi:hypothetical protein